MISTYTTFILSIFIVIGLDLIQPVRSDDLFIGCGFEIDFKEMIFTTLYKSVCYKMCREKSYTYYTHKPDLEQCECYIYPPPASEYMPGEPNECNGQLQYNIITTNWNFDKCYSSTNMTEIPSDSFKACMDGCAPYEVAIARPTGIFPGQTNCICASKEEIRGLEETQCDFEKYYTFTHTPTPVPSGRRAARSLVIAQRQAFHPRGPY